MTQFTTGQKLTAKDLNDAFDSVAGPINPSKDYQWTQTNVGKLQKGWDTFIQIQNQNPDTLEVGIGYSKIGSETVQPVGGKTPAALRRVFVNVGKVREQYRTFGRTFYNCPNIGDTNGIPLLGIVGISYHESDGYYMTGDGKIHYSVWSPGLSEGETPQQWQNNQKLWQDDVARGSDSRGWWWSGITLERFTPEFVNTPQSPDAERLDLCCFPLYLHYSKSGEDWSTNTYSVLCVMLKKDLPSLEMMNDQSTQSAFFQVLKQAYPAGQGMSITRMYLGGQPKNIMCLAQYVYSEKTQNAYYKTNFNYVHFDNDISPFHFSGFEPVTTADYYAPLNQVSFELQWIDDNGKHQSTAGTKTRGITDKEGNTIQPGEVVEHYALACAYNPTWTDNTEPKLSAVTFDEAEVFLTGNPAECILSGLFNESDYGGISSLTQKRLIYLNQMNARGVEYYDTCPDFRTCETPDSDISSSCLSSIQEKDIELEVEEGQDPQSMKLWSLWGFDDFENTKGWPAQSEISGWDLVARHIHEVEGRNVGEIQYISLSALSGGGGAPGDADTPEAGLSSIQTRTLTGGEKVLQLYKFDDEGYVENDIGNNLSNYDMVLRNREDNCVAYGSLSSVGGEVDLSGTDGTHKKGSKFKFKSATDSNIIVSIDNNGVITIGAYYL